MFSKNSQRLKPRARRGYGIKASLPLWGRGTIRLRMVDEVCANKISYRATSIPFLCTEQRNGRKKIGIRDCRPLCIPAVSRPLPVRIACGQAAQFAGAGGIQRQANLCFRRLEVRTAKMEKLTRTGFEALSDLLGENLLRLKPRCARIWN